MVYAVYSIFISSNMIATHNSGTGEPSQCWYHKLLIPFARCQRYNIEQQINKGCKLFDLRVRGRYNDVYDFHLCHGAWKSKTTLSDALQIINKYGFTNNCEYKVIITFEGKLDYNDRHIFTNIVQYLLLNYPKIQLAQIAVKKPKWDVLYTDYITNIKQGFKCLDFSSWHTLIPIPWFWHKVYGNKIADKNSSDDCYILVDFL